MTLPDVFAEKGLLAQRLPGYELRDGQSLMAEAVLNALQTGEPLAVQAGTGLGKTFAYIVPSLLFATAERKKVVISTATLQLQTQLIKKDIPAIEEVKVVDTPAKTEQEELPRGTERILVVDDEDIIANMNKSILERLGYTVTAITSSVEALAKVRTHADDFDLVITDQTMPNLSGVELALEILKIKPGMPIILCSGFSTVISEEGALALGIKKYTMKPVDIRTLAKLAREALDEK